MKSWYITVLQNGLKQVECVSCVSPKDANEKLAKMKEKWIDDPEKGLKYSFFREQF